MINLPDKVYNFLKWCTMIFLPALATLYIALAETWRLPYGQQVSATIMALVVFLGIFLQVNTAHFKARMARIRPEAIIADFHARYNMSNSTYDLLKWITVIFLPATATLYSTLSPWWNLPYSGEISGTISAIVLFCGALLQISAYQYKAANIIAAGGVITEHMVISNKSIFSISNELYDVLKFITQAVLPGLATFYAALSSIWGLPYGELVSATLMAIVFFMSTLLQISTAKYNAIMRSEKD